MANSLDLVLCHPSLSYKGGAERLILEIAKRFNPVIYTADAKIDTGYGAFKEFDIRVIPRHPLEPALFFLESDGRMHISAIAGFRYFNFKIKKNYDVISADVVPSEWIHNKNERVCWYCHSPVRAAFDMHWFQEKGMSFPQKIRLEAVLAAYKFAENSIVPKIEKICTSSEVSNNRIKKYLHRNDAEVIAPGVDCKSFICNDYQKFFFYPSRIVPEKRFEYAIDAFRSFNKGRKWKLIIGGALSDSKRDRDYFAWLVKYAQGERVEFKTNLSESDLRHLYSTCCATVFSAIEEDFGLIPLESMSSYKPCISVNEGGPAYTIIDGKTGFLVNSPEEMAEKMRFLAEHQGECEKMGKAGRKRVEQNYTWKIFLDKMENAYKETARI